jgi:hypothetical protein
MMTTIIGVAILLASFFLQNHFPRFPLDRVHHSKFSNELGKSLSTALVSPMQCATVRASQSDPQPVEQLIV